MAGVFNSVDLDYRLVLATDNFVSFYFEVNVMVLEPLIQLSKALR